MSVVMRAMENAYVINGRSRVAFIPRQDRYMFRVFHSMPREKDGLNEASIKSPFIARYGGNSFTWINFKTRLEANAQRLGTTFPLNERTLPIIYVILVISKLEEESRWPSSKTRNGRNRNSRQIHRVQFTANARIHPHPPDWSLQFARGHGLKTKRPPLKYWRELHRGCRRLFHWPRAPNQLFHVSCSCLDTVRARVSFVNIARAASLRQSTATRDFRSRGVNGATLESARWPLVASLCIVVYCCCRSPVKSSSCDHRWTSRRKLALYRPLI